MWDCTPGQRMCLPMVLIKSYWLVFHAIKKFQDVGFPGKVHSVCSFSHREQQTGLKGLCCGSCLRGAGETLTSPDCAWGRSLLMQSREEGVSAPGRKELKRPQVSLTGAKVCLVPFPVLNQVCLYLDHKITEDKMDVQGECCLWRNDLGGECGVWKDRGRGKTKLV